MSLKQLVVLALGIVFLYGLFTVGAPFLLASVLAMFLEPLTQFWMRTFRVKRVPAAAITSTLFTLFLLFGMYWLGLQMIKQLIALVKNMPTYMQEVQIWVEKSLIDMRGVYQDLPSDWGAGIETVISQAIGHLSSFASAASTHMVSAASALPNMFIFFIVFIVALFFINASLDRFRPTVLRFFDEKSHNQVGEVMDRLRQSVFGFIRAQFILSLFTYVITLSGLLILDTKYPLAIALLVTIVDLLPILGVGSALVPWGVYCMVTGDLFTGVGLVALFVIITALRRILEPKVVGDSVGIGALPALISLYVGFKLVGVIGFFIGPLVVIVFSALRKAGLLEVKFKF
ncbi:sporulation integral membrane protein YtvI [Paenibacillus sp. 481]|uniref:sporulation integral membrane protein YtvI n=1 Tax=Paenibacillus sp. 481 TaxID=2835869 RepID=UPI001E3AC9E8|nr:sporulation integral membrane protein YtvI [Paenibacillus sp. 481]UHA72415.1 sporulation integral membrane protein YtvI [Paenibacillus sp. 481]